MAFEVSEASSLGVAVVGHVLTMHACFHVPECDSYSLGRVEGERYLIGSIGGELKGRVSSAV